MQQKMLFGLSLCRQRQVQVNFPLRWGYCKAGWAAWSAKGMDGTVHSSGAPNHGARLLVPQTAISVYSDISMRAAAELELNRPAGDIHGNGATKTIVRPEITLRKQ
jgi:hypothetical protein